MSNIYDDAGALADANGGRWGEHSRYTVSEWQDEVQNGDTRHGYWEWVANTLDAERTS